MNSVATLLKPAPSRPATSTISSLSLGPPLLAPVKPSHFHAAHPVDAWRRSVVHDAGWTSATVRGSAPLVAATTVASGPSLFATTSIPATAPSAKSSPATLRDGAKGVDTRVSLNDFNAAYRQLNADITREMGPWRGNLARVLTTLGTWGSVGGAVAMGLAAPAALTGLLTGVGVPHGFAAAILGLGVGLAGIAFSVVLGAIVRSMSRRSVAASATLQSKVLVLSQVEAYLSQLQKSQAHALDAGQAALLRNTRKLLVKLDPSFTTSLRKQAVTAAAAPFVFFGSAFNALRHRNDKASGEGVKKRFLGAGLSAELGSTPRSASDAPLVALDGNGQRWLNALRGLAVPVVDPVGSSAQHYAPFAG